MNVICLLGRLTADPELRHTASQIPVTSFTVAVDRAFQPKGSEQRQADFIPVVAWRNTAEFVCRYFHKGQRIAVNGSAYEVVADNVYFAESKNASGPSTGARYESQIPQYNEAPPAFSNAGAGDFEEIVGDDELPF